MSLTNIQDYESTKGTKWCMNGAVLRLGLDRLKQKKFEVIYEYIEPKTIEEKIAQEKMLEEIYFPILDEIQKDLNKTKTNQ